MGFVPRKDYVFLSPSFQYKFLPENISLVQQFIKQNEFRPGHIVIVDTPAGSSQRLWNLVAEGYCVLIPTTLSKLVKTVILKIK